MKQIDIIVHRLTIFYYIFISITIVSVLTGFYFGIVSGLKDAADPNANLPTSAVHISLYVTMVISGVWLLVLFTKMLVAIGLSIKSKSIFDLRLVKLIHRFLILYVITTGCAYVMAMSDNYSTLFSGWQILIDCLSSISSVVMLLMFCEVLKIGNILKAEQDLTV